MKKVLLSIAFLLTALVGFAQSFSVDSKSLTVPRYANQAAITTAIPTPIEGMLVFNNALDVYSYYNGTAWVNFPTQTNPIDSTRIISAARVPSLQALKTAGTISAPSAATAGRIFNIQAYGQTSATASALSGEISFRATQAFNANNSGSDLVFSTRGAAAPLTDRMMIHQDGRFGFGSISTAGYIPSGNMDLNFLNNSEAVPTLHLRGSTTIIRYSRNATNGPGAGIVHTNTINNNTAAGAFMAWKHYDDTVIPVAQTPMMTLTGEGNLTVNGFTKMGGSGTDVPAIKTKYFTGTMTTANGGWPAASYDIAHGLTFSKIISMSVLVTGASNITIAENSSFVGYQYLAYFDNSNIKLIRSSASATASASITPTATVNVTFKVLLTYIP
jgi:hypothetical protein